jgi:phosphopantothenoylcysteine decarboxylase/phosphopantothenate--cysteine ligase
MSAKKVLVGVTGGIAVYKACEVVRSLVKKGRQVRVIMTESARAFVTPLTFEVLSKHPVPEDMFSPRQTPVLEHVEAAAWCDLFAVVPATANLIGKLAAGIADDMLTTVAMAVPAETPRLLAPAMNVHMWENPVLKRNLAYLKGEGGGFHIVDPVKKELACGDIGVGGLATPEDILSAIESLLAPRSGS